MNVALASAHMPFSASKSSKPTKQLAAALAGLADSIAPSAMEAATAPRSNVRTVVFMGLSGLSCSGWFLTARP
ncbi:hypothetical protein [Sorangium sp. So ce117]|uniref:hypothetical protein n=1 Tax=Sorangium sp. So ce117 TaxID=3133277 RepID=UPI003F639D03